MSTVLTLSEVSAGVPRRVVSDPRFDYFNKLHDRKADYKTNTINQSLFYRYTDIPDSACMFHQNYLEYLKKCWTDHLGIVISPDILWFTLLTEFASVVKEAPDKYQTLFTDSEEKKLIVVQSGDLVVMPIDSLVNALREHVPTDMDMFLPKFSTANDRSQHAMYSAFCDVVSPYYDYGMFMCNFPAIDIRGDLDDWKMLSESWRKVRMLCPDHSEWAMKVQNILNDCVENLTKPEWWKNIFTSESCGSGGEININGWYSKLFRIQPKAQPRDIRNFPTCLAVVNYKQMQTEKNYRMRDGLFYSTKEDIFMVPDFGYVIHEIIEVEAEPYSASDYKDQENAMTRFIQRTQHIQ